MFFRFREWKYLRYDIMQRFQHMALRRWINHNPMLISTTTIASFLLFIIILACQLIPNKHAEPKPAKKAWFYDLNTGELFTAKSKLLPPIKAPSGPLPDGSPAGVRAYVFCYDDPNGNAPEPFIGFLETLTPEAKQNAAASKSKPHNANQWATGRSFRRPEEDNFTPADSDHGQEIFNEFFLPDGNKEPTHPYPPQ